MSLELLLSHLHELFPRRSRDNLVVQGLADEEASRRVGSGRRYRLHLWFRDILDRYGNIVLSYQDLGNIEEEERGRSEPRGTAAELKKYREIDGGGGYTSPS